ncbi:tetratricopeptide repeat protein [Archangium violaceum]|uniref:tetratricopeptide repeat protein n=1 Tax=Archangium violaceum TaxID=83451 RepID=UPI001950490C|nr:tetratricopeptide repeat protein [Archangium violaceum]QRN98510.1 tetratricopeptide repeat protein [Archangium violaceum]
MGEREYQDGMARLEAGDVEEGRRLLEAALRASPGSVEVMHGLARALDLAGERGQARALLERAHAQAPGEPGPACDLAMLYLEEEEGTRAERVLAPVLAAHPEHPRANLCMAMALAKAQPERARGHVVKALQETEPEGRRQAEALRRVLGA